MVPEMFVNEISIAPPAADVHTAQRRIEQFVRTMLRATSSGIRRALHLPVDFYAVTLGPNYVWQSWLRDNRIDRELRRYFLSLATQVPFLRDEPEAETVWAGMDCYCGGQKALGLKAAYVTDGLAVSLQTDVQWTDHRIACSIQEVVDDDIDERNESIHHASRPEHMEPQRSWIQQRLQSAVGTGAELWQGSAEIFPLLQFCDAVEGQMGDLPTEALASVIRGLFCLNTYCDGWGTGAFDPDCLGCAVSPESQSTRDQYGAERTFLCPDAQHRTFTWHVKAGHWRIYFDPAPGPGQLFVGYVGKHLRTARFN